jgi:ribosomal protein L21
MVRTYGLLTAIVALIGAVAVVGPAFAKAHHHHSGEQLLGSHIKTNGEHVIHKAGDHTVAVQVANGKVAGLHVKHSKKGDVPVKKYKTKKKMAQSDGFRYASFTLVQYQDLGTTYIGYAFIDDYGDEQIYWFPYEMILDGDTGAVEYVPLT